MSATAQKMPRVSVTSRDVIRILGQREPYDTLVHRSDLVLGTLEANLYELGAVLNQIVDGLISLLQAGHELDLDDLIANLLRYEEEQNRDRKTFEKVIARDFRDRVRSRPDTIRLANEICPKFLGLVDRGSELYRDARWRLMRARAEYMPSKGKGTIHGSPTDTDDYLKTLA